MCGDDAGRRPMSGAVVRKLVTVTAEIHREMERNIIPPTRRAAAAATSPPPGPSGRRCTSTGATSASWTPPSTWAWVAAGAGGERVPPRRAQQPQHPHLANTSCNKVTDFGSKTSCNRFWLKNSRQIPIWAQKARFWLKKSRQIPIWAQKARSGQIRFRG